MNQLDNLDTDESRLAGEKGLIRTSYGRILSCPKCGGTHIKRNGKRCIKSTGEVKQVYKCVETFIDVETGQKKKCNTKFTEDTGTIFEKMKIEEWQLREIIAGTLNNLSCTRIARDTGLGVKAVWENRTKIAVAVTTNLLKEPKFRSIVECDETEVHLSFKGTRNPEFFIYTLGRMSRHHRSRAERIAYLKKHGLYDELEASNPEYLEFLLSNGNSYLPGTKKDSVNVVTAIDRGSREMYMKPASVGKLTSRDVVKHFTGKFESDSIVVTDGNNSYRSFVESEHLHHEAIPADKHAKGPFNLATVNSKHSKFNATYAKHKENLPATKNLSLWTTFFCWLEANKELTTDQKVELIYSMLRGCQCEVTYNTLRYRKIQDDIDIKSLSPNQVDPDIPEPLLPIKRRGLMDKLIATQEEDET